VGKRWGKSVKTMLTLFTLPDGALSSTTAYIGDFFESVSPFVYLAIGLPLGYWVIRKVISLIPKHR
jgi:hypothetical protein